MNNIINLPPQTKKQPTFFVRGSGAEIITIQNLRIGDGITINYVDLANDIANLHGGEKQEAISASLQKDFWTVVDIKKNTNDPVSNSITLKKLTPDEDFSNLEIANIPIAWFNSK